MNLTYKEILNLKNLNHFEPEQVISLLGIIFETGRKNRIKKDISFGLTLAEKQNFECFSDDDRMTFHYNVANGWSYLQQLTQNINSDEFWSFNLRESEQQIINLRLALSFSKKQ